MHNELREKQEVLKMYVLLSSIEELLNAARDIVLLLADMKPLTRKEIAMLEKDLLIMIRYALSLYEQALEQSLEAGQNEMTE